MKRLLLLTLICLMGMTGIANAAGQTVILAAFGTSQPGAKQSLDAIAAAYEKQGDTVIWAFTSDIIRRKLAKQGTVVFSVDEAMNEAAKKGIKDLRIQSLHISPSEEFNKLQRMIVRNMHRNPNRFATIQLGHPLLESAQDLKETVEAVLQNLPKERKKQDAVVFMGHGNDRGPGDILMQATYDALRRADNRVWLATVEGANSFDKVLPKLKKAGVKKVWLVPFMMVAGDHAHNDLAGDEEDSWASLVKAAGMTPVPVLHGLGENPGIQKIFMRHTEKADDDVMKEKD